jgi:hypothetical protein
MASTSAREDIVNKRYWILACALAAGGCAMDEEIGSNVEAITPVTWMNAVRVTADGNSLTRFGSRAAWNAGAASVETLAGDGFMEFTTLENYTAKMAGLSNGDTDQSYTDIDFAIYLKSTGRVAIYEAGILRNGNITGYVAGDLFRVEAAGDQVTYAKNGVVLYTSGVSPTFPLLVDTAMRDPNASIADVEIESLEFWQNAVGAVATGNDLLRDSTLGGWNAGASSIRSLAGDGYAEFSTAEATTNKMAGLSNGDAGQSYTDIDFAINLRANGTVWIYQGGVRIARVGTYVAGDQFRIDVSGGVVTYWKNGALLHTSSGTPAFPLVLDSAILTNGGTITDARLTSL